MDADERKVLSILSNTNKTLFDAQKSNRHRIEGIRSEVQKSRVEQLEKISIRSMDSALDELRDEIYNRTKATIVDMESASIGHISRKNNVPFVCIRTVSDFADGNDDFEKEAGERSTEIVKKIIENL